MFRTTTSLERCQHCLLSSVLTWDPASVGKLRALNDFFST